MGIYSLEGRKFPIGSPAAFYRKWATILWIVIFSHGELFPTKPILKRSLYEATTKWGNCRLRTQKRWWKSTITTSQKIVLQQGKNKYGRAKKLFTRLIKKCPPLGTRLLRPKILEKSKGGGSSSPIEIKVDVIQVSRHGLNENTLEILFFCCKLTVDYFAESFLVRRLLIKP